MAIRDLAQAGRPLDSIRNGALATLLLAAPAAGQQQEDDFVPDGMVLLTAHLSLAVDYTRSDTELALTMARYTDRFPPKASSWSAGVAANPARSFWGRYETQTPQFENHVAFSSGAPPNQVSFVREAHFATIGDTIRITQKSDPRKYIEGIVIGARDGNGQTYYGLKRYRYPIGSFYRFDSIPDGAEVFVGVHPESDDWDAFVEAEHPPMDLPWLHLAESTKAGCSSWITGVIRFTPTQNWKMLCLVDTRRELAAQYDAIVRHALGIEEYVGDPVGSAPDSGGGDDPAPEPEQEDEPADEQEDEPADEQADAPDDRYDEGYDEGYADGHRDGFAAPRRACSVDGTTLGLAQATISVLYGDVTADTPAHVVPEQCSNEAGVFTFYNPDNWEVMVRVLNGCAINGHYWASVIALTDRAWEATFTVAGETRTYTEDTSIDTRAFPCAP